MPADWVISIFDAAGKQRVALAGHGEPREGRRAERRGADGTARGRRLRGLTIAHRGAIVYHLQPGESVGWTIATERPGERGRRGGVALGAATFGSGFVLSIVIGVMAASR